MNGISRRGFIASAALATAGVACGAEEPARKPEQRGSVKLGVSAPIATPAVVSAVVVIKPRREIPFIVSPV